MKKRIRNKFNSKKFEYKNLVYAVKTITPVVTLIREANTNEELSESKYYDIVDRVCEYNDYAELFSSYINIDVVRDLVKENFTDDQKLAMLYLIFNSAVKFRTRKKIVKELENDFPEEIEAMKKYSFRNAGLETFIK